MTFGLKDIYYYSEMREHMSKKLVIVESPAKSKTIGQYLGKEYNVLSSVGHIRDLAVVGAGGLGVDVEHNFKPTYEVLADKKQVIHKLNQALKTAEEVYLATDPDREGEAISWHLSETLNIKGQPVYRVYFNEITRSAILEAFLRPGEINRDLVNSQETRRILDRIIGFKLSKLLQSKIKSKSAGRVQSAALKLIVDRENEINEFNIEEYYDVFAQFGEIKAKLVKIGEADPSLTSQSETERFIESLSSEFKVANIEVKPYSNNPRPAFITSTLQQMASNKFGFTPTKTMKIAQTLYEGKDIGNETVGLITYMRTDSIRLSEAFVSETRSFIIKEYGHEYYGNMRRNVNKENAQDAHEAIRPTSIFRTPKSIKQFLSPQEYKLYQMIYARALASLMKPRKTETTAIILENKNAKFRVSSTKQLFDGYMKVYLQFDTDEEEPETDLSSFKQGESMKSDGVTFKQMFTQPPARYTEASLIKKMEDLGIGRPSTYATTIQTIKNRKYVELKEKKFEPTEQGNLTIKKLDKYFHEFIGAHYSKEMEVVLDEIAVGKADRNQSLDEFYQFFMPLVINAEKNMSRVKPEPTGEHCPVCGSPMVTRNGKYGKFEACSNFPKCKYIKPNENVKKSETFDTKVPCPDCEGATLVVRTASKGKNKGKKFLAASTFPKCKYISPLKVLDENCPVCGNILVEDENKVTRCIDIHCGYKK